MPGFNVEQLRTDAMSIVERIGVDERLDAMIVGGVLVIVLSLALVAIWKNRRRTAEVPAAAPSAASRRRFRTDACGSTSAASAVA